MQDADRYLEITVIATGLDGKRQESKPESKQEKEPNALDLIFRHDGRVDNVVYTIPDKDDKKNELQIPVFLVKNAKMRQNAGKR